MTSTLPAWAVMGLAHLVLLVASLALFLPDGFVWPGARDAQRLFRKYARYIFAAAVVLTGHLLLVQTDLPISRLLGYDLGQALLSLEGGLLPFLWAGRPEFLDVILSVAYILVHPFMVYFAALLFMLSDEERAAKAALLLFPMTYVVAFPLYLLLPASNPARLLHEVSPAFQLFPQAADVFYLFTSPNNTIPALSVAVALLIANAARYSRNRRFKPFAYAYAALTVAAPAFLGFTWVTGTVAGVLLAVGAAGLTNRVLSVERLALQRVKPEPELAQAIQDTAQALVGFTREKALELDVGEVEPMLVGSVAKDTYLKDRVDFDVFVLFPPTLPREELQSRGLRLGHAVLPDGIEKYAEHPYVHGEFRGFEADLVPAYKVASPEERMSAVDRTPFHTRFVIERMEREQRDQVRLLKQFMLGLGAYGAEAKTRGFSGYLCELLVLKYGSFRGVVRAAAKWTPGTFLALDVMEGNPKFSDPIVFIDPVDARRNAASAVSAETLTRFVEGCRAYLAKESLAFFFPHQLVPLTLEELERATRRRRGEFMLISFPKPQDILEDHLHDQMRKATAAITSLLERHEFEVKKTTHELDDEARIVFELARLRLSEAAVHTGPPVRVEEHANRFRKAWQGSPDALSDVYEEGGRLKVKRRREFRRVEDLVRAKLDALDLGKHLSPVIKAGLQVAVGPDVVREDTAVVLTRHLSRKKPWEL